VDDAVTVVAEKPLELFKRLEKSAAWASVICPLPSCRGNAGSPAVFGTGKCASCKENLDPVFLSNAMRLSLHALTAKYFDQLMQCDEEECRRSTRQVGLYGDGARCQFGRAVSSSRPCPGTMRPVFPDTLLSDHLRLLHKLSKGEVPLEGVEQQEAPDEDRLVRARMVDEVIQRCDCNFVNVASLFGCMYRQASEDTASLQNPIDIIRAAR